MKKKIIYIILLIILIIGIIVFFKFLNKSKDGNNDATTIQRAGASENRNNQEKKTIIKTLSDGTLYTFTDEDIKADVIIGDNYFDTQINNMYTNSSDYDGKLIEIEGFYLQSEGTDYTFVSRYSTNSMCPNCANGYSYIEYMWDGEKPELIQEESWIKVIGKLEKGNDESSYYQDFYYLRAVSLEVMNEKGQDTVEN